MVVFRLVLEREKNVCLLLKFNNISKERIESKKRLRRKISVKKKEKS